MPPDVTGEKNMPEPTTADVDNSAQTTPAESSTAQSTAANTPSEEDTQLEQDIRDAMGVIDDVPSDEKSSHTTSSESVSDTAHSGDAGDDAQMPNGNGAHQADATQHTTAKENAGGGDGTDENGAQGNHVQSAQQTHDAPAMTRFDKRLVNLALTNAALNGADVDAEDIAQRVKGMSFEDKKAVLAELLEDNRSLRGDEEPTEADVEALADARAEEMLIEQELAEAQEAQLAQAQAWHQELDTLIKEHPELDESSNDYDPTLAQALELAVLDGTDADGNPVPRYGVDPAKAYEAIVSAREQALMRKQKQAERNRTRALSGAVNGASSSGGAGGTLTWEDMARIQREDPERYEYMIENGELPPE